MCPSLPRRRAQPHPGEAALAQPSGRACSLRVHKLGRTRPMAIAMMFMTMMTVPTLATAAPPPRASTALPRELPPALARVAALVSAAEDAVKAAEAAATATNDRSDAVLARRLVDGQVALTQGSGEAAAVIFLDVLEAGPGTPAAVQARYYLGEALLLLGQRDWAGECFSATLADPTNEGQRLQQRSVARLLGLATPPGPRGRARKPGRGVLPEQRARLQSLGLGDTPPQTPEAAPRGAMGPGDILRLRGWVMAIPGEQRTSELRYAYGRHLFLSGDDGQALAELEALSPADQPVAMGSPDAAWQLRAAYIAGAAATALGQVDRAHVHFARVAVAKVRRPADRELQDLAWLARGRLYLDTGEPISAISAYRQVGRSSPLRTQAMYEVAWALLRADRPELALATLDQVIQATPGGPLATESRLLQAKLHVQQKSWQAAETAFSALRSEFSASAAALAGSLTVEGDAAAYYAAVAASDGPEFRLDAVVPVSALGMARDMRRATQAETLARALGEVQTMLRDTEAMLTRMEAAAVAPERVTLFLDLGARSSSLDQSSFELLTAAEQLLDRQGVTRSVELRKQRADVDLLRAGRSLRAKQVATATDEVAAQRAETSAMRAGVIALEQAQLASGRPRSADFFANAAAVRNDLGAHEAEVMALYQRVDEARATLRFVDPLLATRRAEVQRYQAALFAVLAQTKPTDANVQALQLRILRAGQGLIAARGKLQQAADRRLAATIVVLREERQNLDDYAKTLASLQPQALEVIGQTTAAVVRDLGAELGYWTTRSEVGQLDVVWAKQRAEQDGAEQLERHRDLGLKQLERALDQMVEDLE